MAMTMLVSPTASAQPPTARTSLPPFVRLRRYHWPDSWGSFGIASSGQMSMASAFSTSGRAA